MYQDKHYSNEFLKMVLRIIIVILVLLLTLKFIIILTTNGSGHENKTFKDNLNYIDSIAKTYFNEENIPSSSGEFKEYSINEILSEDEIKYMNETYMTCDYKDSIIKVTRLDSEYQIKIVLNCNNETNYLNSFVPLENKKEIVITTTKKATITTKKKKKTTTSVIKYRVSFNTNGGNYIEDMYVLENEKIDVVPVREGYTFVGWYYNNELFEGKIDRNYVLVAKWVKN